MTTPMEHAKIAADNASGLYLTANEAAELVADARQAENTREALEYEIGILREANADWMEKSRIDADELNDADYEAEGLREELANAHEAYARLRTYTVGALAAYAKDRLRLIEERDKYQGDVLDLLAEILEG